MKKFIIASLLLFTGATQASQMDCLAKAMYREALNQSPEGRVMVGVVINNRAEGNKFCSVTENKKIFPWREFTLPESKVKPIKREWFDFKQGKIKVPEKLLKATHFHHKKIKPKWSKKLKYLGSVGDHKFYQEV